MKKIWLMFFVPLLVFTVLSAKNTDGVRKATTVNQELAALAADAADQDAFRYFRLRPRSLSREKTVHYPFLGERWIEPQGDVSLFQVLSPAGIIPVEITDASGTSISEYEVGDTIVINITYGDSVWVRPYVDNGDGIFDPETDFLFAPGDPKEDEEEIIVIDGDDDDETDDGDGIWQLTFYTGEAGEEDMLFILQGVKIFFSLSNSAGTDTGLDTLDVLPLVSETSLSGNVIKSDEAPAPNVVMVAFPMPTTEMEGPPKSMFVTLTDAEGDYTLFIEDDAADGDFGLLALDFLGQYPGLFPDPQMAMIPVASGDNLIDNDFVFIEPTAVIRGILTDADEPAGPIAGVRIFAGLDGPLGVYDTTDVDGKYNIPVVSGRWYVYLEEDDLIEQGYMAPHGEEDFDISDEDTVEVNFVAYEADATISGTVTLDGIALPGLEIGAWGEPVGYTFTESGANGSYTLNVSSEVDVRGYDIWPEDMPEQTFFADELWGIQPAETDVDINLVTVYGGITGVVTDEASGEVLNDVGIEVRDATGANYHTGVDWETGEYLIYLPDGVYELMAFSHEHLPYQSEPITVAGSVLEHNIVLKELVFTAKIGGTLTDNEDNPIAGVRIFAGTEDMFGMEETTDAAGQYVIPAFPGLWFVHIFDEDLIERGYMVPYGKEGFEVAEEDSIPVDFVTYATDATITGTVTWEDDDSAVEYAEIHGDTQAGYFSRARTGSDGTYSLPVSSELDSVVITGEGEETWKTHGYCINVWTKDALAQPPDSCEVYSADTGIDFTMYHADAFLSGHISDQWGNPIPHLGLHAFTIEGALEFRTHGGGTEFGGSYEMPLLGGYKWVVQIFLPPVHDEPVKSDTIDVVSGDNLVRDYTITLLSITAPMAGGNLPVDYALGDNYPNPFNPSTTITYQLPEAGHVTLRIYDLTGKVVNTLVGEYRPAGYHQVVWNGRDSRSAPVATGVYFYRIVAGKSYTETRKMVLIK